MRSIKDLADKVNTQRKKEKVERLINDVQREMLLLDQDFGIKVNVLTFDDEQNHMLETCTD